jgi:hypothetical protein
VVASSICIGAHPRGVVVEELLLRFPQIEFLGQGFGSGRVSSAVRPRGASTFQWVRRMRAARKAGSFGVDIGGARLGVAALLAADGAREGRDREAAGLPRRL